MMMSYAKLESANMETDQSRRPKLRFKDVLKRDLVDFNIPTRSWPQLASHRSSWRSMLL